MKKRLKHMTTLDLTALVDGRDDISVISGKDRGILARAEMGISDLDEIDETVTVLVPDSVRAITPSFVLGLFGPSIRKYGSQERFFDHYSFDAKPYIVDQIRRAIGYGLLKGNAFEAA